MVVVDELRSVLRYWNHVIGCSGDGRHNEGGSDGREGEWRGALWNDCAEQAATTTIARIRSAGSYPSKEVCTTVSSDVVRVGGCGKHDQQCGDGRYRRGSFQDRSQEGVYVCWTLGNLAGLADRDLCSGRRMIGSATTGVARISGLVEF